jgi:hypothetical protein
LPIGELLERQKASDLAEEIGMDGIRTILNLMCTAYFDLYKSGKAKLGMSEYEITEEWCFFITIRWRKVPELSVFPPIHEKSDKTQAKKMGRPPTIDFCFRGWEKTLYFGAECKILKEGNSKSITGYIEDGMERYISGKYAQKCSTGAMIGYIFSDTIDEIVKEINEKLNELYKGSTIRIAEPLGTFKEHHESDHERTSGVSPFLIHHLFFALN